VSLLVGVAFAERRVIALESERRVDFPPISSDEILARFLPLALHSPSKSVILLIALL